MGADGFAVAPAGAPPEVQKAIAAGNEIAKTPYKYGGGHAKLKDTGYDCSGSISYALRKAGIMKSSLASGPMMKFGETRPRRVDHPVRQLGPRLHGHRRPALRHQRPQAGGLALVGRVALQQGIHRAPPRGLLGLRM